MFRLIPWESKEEDPSYMPPHVRPLIGAIDDGKYSIMPLMLSFYAGSMSLMWIRRGYNMEWCAWNDCFGKNEVGTSARRGIHGYIELFVFD